MNQSFEQLKLDLSTSLNLTHSNGSGWMSCYCPVCQKTDRMTAGLRFEGDSIQFNCFRASCQASCAYELGSPITRKFKDLCRSLNVTIPIDLKAVKSSFQKKIQEELESDLYKKNFYDEMKVPDNFIHHEEVRSSLISPWVDYMMSRKCSMEDCYYVRSGQYEGWMAVASYYFDKLIGFQLISRKGKVKYINFSNNHHVIFINERKIRNPVVLVEGVLDAKCFPNAVALLGHKVTPEKAFHLRGRDVILVPDRRGGDKFVQAAKDYGWKISFPEWEEHDLNSSVCRYGVMEAARMIRDGTIDHTSSSLEVSYKLWRDCNGI